MSSLPLLRMDELKAVKLKPPARYLPKVSEKERKREIKEN